MKRKLLLIAFVLLLSLTATSQTATQDSVVILPKWRVELIINDLYRLDYLDSLNELNKLRVGLFERQLVAADSIVLNLSTAVARYESVIIVQSSIRSDLSDQTNYWKKEYKKQKRQKFLVGGVSIILLILVAL